MKYLFLDIDDVLNSDEYFNSERFKTLKSDASVLLAQRNTLYIFMDSEKVLMINEIVEKTGCKVILSSTWRSIFPFDEMNEIFKKSGATFTLSGMTPLTVYGQKISEFVSRGRKIREYISHSIDDSCDIKIAILDDRGDMSPYLAFLFQTNRKLGLTEQIKNRVIESLNDNFGKIRKSLGRDI